MKKGFLFLTLIFAICIVPACSHNKLNGGAKSAGFPEGHEYHAL